jgi:putative oxidoreductase
MKGFLAFLNLKFLPASPDFGLLLLRVVLGSSMLILHGWKKLELYMGWGRWFGAGKESARRAAIAAFPDPLHISPQWSLLSGALVEVVCSALLIIGFCARFAAAGLVVMFSVAFFMVHNRALTGLGDDGERAMVYLAAFAALLFAGPGKLSFDGSSAGGGAH